jgi:DNA-binding NarL/FixJ family response regulator
MTTPITIGIAEDHPMLRNAMIRMLSDEPDFQPILEASNGSELLDALTKKQIDILLLDITMPVLSGLQILPQIQRLYPELKIIVFSSHLEKKIIIEAFQNGVKAYLTKNVDFEKIIEAIYHVYESGYYLNEHLPKELYEDIRKRQKCIEKQCNNELTIREKQILKLICEGYSNNIISQKLFISIRTVENHRKHIFDKTSTKGLADLVIYAVRNGYFIIKDTN